MSFSRRYSLFYSLFQAARLRGIRVVLEPRIEQIEIFLCTIRIASLFQVVPELDMPGHAASWAFAEPSAVVRCPRRVSSDGLGLEHGIDKVVR